jgi:hypothetical protein
MQVSHRAIRHPLVYQDDKIGHCTWIAPWTSMIMSEYCRLAQCVELDASFFALRPCVYIVPMAVIANWDPPLGLIVCPSERHAQKAGRD